MICNTGKIIDPNEIEGEPDFIDLLVVKNTKSKKKPEGKFIIKDKTGMNNLFYYVR